MTIKFIIQNQPIELVKRGSFLLFRCNYDNRHFCLELFDLLQINFPLSLEKAVVKRQSEYLAGRYVAKFALQKLGVKVCDIATNQHRAPMWPDKVVGSITHTEDTALCAVGFNHDIEYLGIDLEKWLAAETVTEITDMVISRRERLLLEQLDLSYPKAFTLVFSVKESLFKALYPTVGHYFDFDSVEVLDISIKKKTVNLVITKRLNSLYPVGRRISGFFDCDNLGVFTCVSG